MQHAAAFFDVDETLINIKSMFDFLDFWRKENNERTLLHNYMENFLMDVKRGEPREQLNREYYRQFADVSYSALEEAGERWFNLRLNSELFIESSVTALKNHQAENRHVVFISGSMLPILSPVARCLGVKDILCASLKLTDAGKVTGEIGYPQTIGDGKKEALIKFCEQRCIKPSDCYAYGDDLSDIPMLESVGYPVCVGKPSALARHAIKHRWAVI